MKVYTYGAFDLLHVGHLELLQEARDLGGYLIVGVFTDEVVAGFKRTPIIPLDQRVKMLRELFIVNEVVVQKQYDPTETLKIIRPGILAKGPGAGWAVENDKQPGQEFMDEIGGRTQYLDYHEGQSTSAIIEKIKGL